MKQIYELFVPEDARKIRTLMEETGRTELCWYPSSGGNLPFFEMDQNSRLLGRLFEQGEVEVRTPSDRSNLFYIFTDVTAGNLISEIGTRDSIEVIEVNLLQPIFGNDWSPAVVHFTPTENAGRVFLLKFRTKSNEEEEEIIPVLFFDIENLTFLVHTLMANRIKVKALYHFRDGGGTFGGSGESMMFIYPALNFLGVELINSEYFDRLDGFDEGHFTSMLIHEIEYIASGNPIHWAIFEELIATGYGKAFERYREYPRYFDDQNIWRPDVLQRQRLRLLEMDGHLSIHWGDRSEVMDHLRNPIQTNWKSSPAGFVRNGMNPIISVGRRMREERADLWRRNRPPQWEEKLLRNDTLRGFVVF